MSKAPGMQIIRHVDLTETQATALTERIRTSMGDLMALVVKAWLGRAWIALGYESWAEYIKGEFNHAPLSLPREERKAVTALLRKQGMSTRAIAPTFGVAQKTVVNDLATEEFYSLDGPVSITGLGAKSVYFYRTTAWIDFGTGPIVRFMTSKSIYNNIIDPFDKGDRESIEPGIYPLTVPCPSQSLTDRAPSVKTDKKRKYTGRKVTHYHTDRVVMARET